MEYLYDAAYQLTKETRTGGNSYTQSFWYDSSGNRTKKDLGGTPTQYYYDYIDRMTKYGTTAMEWDTWGDMTKLGSHTYFQDDTDRLTKFDHATGTSNDATYGYLPGSWKRYKRVQDTTVEYYIYDGPNVVASYASNGDLNARYVTPGLDGNLSVTRGGNTYYYMTDGLGSVRNVVESDEDTANTYDYYAFGNTLGTPTVGVTNPYEYTAREFEDGSVNTTFYYRNRYYMSALGIFTSRDAMRADGHRGWGYLGNSAPFFVDPWGLELEVHDGRVTGPGGVGPGGIGEGEGRNVNEDSWPAPHGAEDVAAAAKAKSDALSNDCPGGKRIPACAFSVARKVICCSDGSRTVCCRAFAGDSNTANENVPNIGPLPHGRWRIGTQRVNNGTWWFDLHHNVGAWRTGEEKWAGYDEPLEDHGGRNRFAIHGGTKSQGCVCVSCEFPPNGAGTPNKSNDCYDALRDVLNDPDNGSYYGGRGELEVMD